MIQQLRNILSKRYRGGLNEYMARNDEVRRFLIANKNKLNEQELEQARRELDRIGMGDYI